MRQIILDTETTGRDAKNDRIVEFAGLEMIDRKLTGRTLQVYINPECSIDPDAEAVHGLSRSMLEKHKIFKEEAQNIIDFIQGAELIIHNAPFDVGFLNEEFKRNKFNVRVEDICSITDTLVMARNKFPGKKNSLDALCDRLFIDRSNREYHGALIDCKLLSDVYLRMTTEQQNLSLSTSSNIENFIWESSELCKVSINQQEIEAHENYIKGIKNSLWGKYLTPDA